MNIKQTCLTFTLIILITMVSFSQTNLLSYVLEMRIVTHKSMKICEPHSPIVITNESDFSDLGFSGNGSFFNPYLIQELEISTTEDCLSISNIRANFTIKNCILTSESHESGCGILLDNSTSGTIEGCTINNKDAGIKLDHADVPSIKRCSISGCRIGVYVFGLFNCSIENNHIYDCSKYGILIALTLFSELLNNTVHDNNYCGIALSSTDESTVANNTVYNNLYGSRNMFFDSFGGISLEWCDECVVADNTIINNNEAGIYLYDLYNTTLERNSISGGLNGIWTDRSYSCDMFDNNLFNNSMSDVFLDESPNCTLTKNLMEQGVLIEGFSWPEWNHTLNDNVIKEKQLVSLKGLTNSEVECSTVGQLIVFNSTGLNVTNADFLRVCTGIEMGFCTNIVAQFISASDCSQNGILVEQSKNVTLSDLKVTSCALDGMKIARCANVTLTRCNITNCMEDGIEFEVSCNQILTNINTKNNMKTGLRFTESSGELISISNSFENGSIFFDSKSIVDISGKFENSLVNGKEILYMNGETDNAINGEYYGQVFLRNCTNVSIQHGKFYGIQFALSNECRAEQFQSMSAEIGVYLSNSWNCTLSHAEVFENHRIGISIYKCKFVKVDYSFVYDNIIRGIDTESSNYSKITNNHVWNQNYGANLDDCLNSLLSNNTFRNSSRGINLFESGNITIVNETVFDCTNQGIRVFRTDFVNISKSLVYGTKWGIEVWQADYSLIFNNHILANFDVGIYLNQAAGHCRVYNNTIGCNENNAYDYGYSNLWDDGSGIGNGWCNYNGSGIYDIPGNAASADNYPTTIPPHLNRAMDMKCEAGQSECNVTWMSLCHRYYVILRNGSLVKESTWDGMLITASLEGLGIGLYNYTVRVNGSDGTWLEDTVFVTIQDTTPPTIDYPEDIQYEKGVSGNAISWNPMDASPSSYEVYRNDSLVDSDSWNGSVIIVSVDGLEVGTYNYSIIVYDGSGHSTSDHVIVSVIPASVTTTTKTTTLVTTTTTSTTETTTTSSATQATTMTTLPNHILAVLIMASILVGVTLFLGIWYRKRK